MAVEYLHICTCVSMCVRVSECVWFCMHVLLCDGVRCDCMCIDSLHLVFGRMSYLCIIVYPFGCCSVCHVLRSTCSVMDFHTIGPGFIIRWERYIFY